MSHYGDEAVPASNYRLSMLVLSAQIICSGRHGPFNGSTLQRFSTSTLQWFHVFSLRPFALLLFLCTVSVPAQTPTSAFEAANKLYYENKFSEAAAAYEKLCVPGAASPVIYFNLGNAWFKAGEIGRALAAYRRAEQLVPRDPDIRANLQFARNQTQGPSFLPNRWELALGRLTLNEWTVLASATVWFWFLLLAVLQWRPSWQGSLKKLLLGLGVVAVILCACVAVALYEKRAGSIAVVIARDAVVRHGPLDESQNAFTVHDGAELRVLDRKEGWLLVTTDPRRTGWIRRDQVLLDKG